MFRNIIATLNIGLLTTLVRADPKEVFVTVNNNEPSFGNVESPVYSASPFVGLSTNRVTGKSTQVYYDNDKTYLLNFSTNHQYESPAVEWKWTRQKDAKIVPMDMITLSKQSYTAIAGQTMNLINIVKNKGLCLLDVIDGDGNRVWRAKLEPAGAGDQINCRLFSAAEDGDGYSIGMVYESWDSSGDLRIEYIKFNMEGHMSPRMVLEEIKNDENFAGSIGGVKVSALSGGLFAVAYKQGADGPLKVTYYKRDTGEFVKVALLEKWAGTTLGDSAFDMMGNMESYDEDEQVPSELDVIVVNVADLSFSKCTTDGCSDPYVVLSGAENVRFPRLLNHKGGLYLFYSVDEGLTLLGQQFDADCKNMTGKRIAINYSDKSAKGVESLNVSKAGDIMLIAGVFQGSGEQFAYTFRDDVYCDYHPTGGSLVLNNAQDPVTVTSDAKKFTWDNDKKTLTFVPGESPHTYKIAAKDSEGNDVKLEVQWPQCSDQDGPPTSSTTSTPHAPIDVLYTVENEDVYVEYTDVEHSKGPRPQSRMNQMTSYNLIVYYDKANNMLSAMETNSKPVGVGDPFNIGYKQAEGVVYQPSDMLAFGEDETANKWAVCMYATVEEPNKEFTDTFVYVVLYEEGNMKFERALRYQQGGDFNCTLTPVKDGDDYNIGVSVLSLKSNNIEYFLLDGTTGEDVDNSYPKTLVEDAADSYGTASQELTDGNFALIYKVNKDSPLVMDVISATGEVQTAAVLNIDDVVALEGDKSFGVGGQFDRRRKSYKEYYVTYVDKSGTKIMIVTCKNDGSSCEEPEVAYEDPQKRQLSWPRVQSVSRKFYFTFVAEDRINLFILSSSLQMYKEPYAMDNPEIPGGQTIGQLSMNQVTDYKVGVMGMYKDSNLMYFYHGGKDNYCEYRMKAAKIQIIDAIDPNDEDSFHSLKIEIESGGIFEVQDEYNFTIFPVQPSQYYQIYATDHDMARYREAVTWPACWDESDQ